MQQYHYHIIKGWNLQYLQYLQVLRIIPFSRIIIAIEKKKENELSGSEKNRNNGIFECHRATAETQIPRPLVVSFTIAPER